MDKLKNITNRVPADLKEKHKQEEHTKVYQMNDLINFIIYCISIFYL